VFDEEVVEGHLQIGVGAFGLGPEVVVEDGNFFCYAAVGSLIPDDRIKTFDIAPPLFVI